MKKLIPISLIAAATLYAGTTINTGWNLVGAVADVNPSTINCAKTVWTYDQTNGWSLFQNVDSTQNFNYPTLSNISMGSGFWINSTCDTTIDATSTTASNDLNMTTSTATKLTWSQLASMTTPIIGVEEDEDHAEYSVWDINTSTFSITEKEYDYSDTSWEFDEKFGGTITPNTDYNISIVESVSDFGADIIIKDTKQITSIGDTTYSNLFVTDIEIVVTVSGLEETHMWNWAPTYWDGSSSVAVTTNTELKNMFLTNSNWFGDDYAMMSGNTSDTSGNIVKGIQDGLWEGCTVTAENNCKKIVRTSAVIGSWTFDSNGIAMDLPRESQTLSIVSNTDSSTGYVIQSKSVDKVGSIWEEQLYTGSDVSESLTQSLLTQ